MASSRVSRTCWSPTRLVLLGLFIEMHMVYSDKYDDLVLIERPWGYWKLQPVLGWDSLQVPDSSGRSLKLRNGRFQGVLQEDNTCTRKPCVWWDGQDNQTFVSFNARGRITIPQFYLPAVQSFTVELLVSLRCPTHDGAATQSIFRLLNESTVFTPRILIEGNEIAAYVNLNDPERNSSYFMKMDSVRAANGNSSFPASSWHHVALIFNGTHLNLHINGTLRQSRFQGNLMQFGGPCSKQRQESKCIRARGIAVGEGFNGKLARLAVYDSEVSEDALIEHWKTFEDIYGQPLNEPSNSSKKGVFAECDQELGNAATSEFAVALVASGCSIAGMLVLVVAAILHLNWSNLAHGNNQLEKNVRELAIPEHFPVLHAHPVYPTAFLAVLAGLLAVSYSSDWYRYPSFASQDGRTVSGMHYLFWGFCESGGSLLLLACSDYLNPTGAGAIVLLIVCWSAVFVCFSADLAGTGRSSLPLFLGLCNQPLTFESFRLPPPVTLIDDGSCVRGVGYPLVAIAVLSLVPAYVLSSLPSHKILIDSNFSLPHQLSRKGKQVEQGTLEETAAMLSAGASTRSDARPSWSWRWLLLLKPWWSSGRAPGVDKLDETSVFERSSRSRNLRLLRIWFFTVAISKRALWIGTVAMKQTDLNGDQRLCFGALLDMVSVCAMAVIMCVSKISDWPTQRKRLSSFSSSRSTSADEASSWTSEERRSEQEDAIDSELEISQERQTRSARSERDGRSSPSHMLSKTNTESQASDEEERVWINKFYRDEVLMEELIRMGYIVWQEPMRLTAQAVHAVNFRVARSLSFLVLVSSFLAMLGFVTMRQDESVYALNCWTTALDLPWQSWEDVGEKRLMCPRRCEERNSLLLLLDGFLSGSPEASGSPLGQQPVWGWNDVFGGPSAAGGVQGYADRTALCRGALHSGILGKEGGSSRCFTLKLSERRSEYAGSLRNGVESLSLDLSQQDDARFSVEFEEATKPCPFALRWHAAACVIPMMSAFVAFSLPPLLLWIFLLCGCFWMYGWLGLFASMQTLSALGLRGSEGEMQAQLMPQGLISPLLHLLALSPALYLLGPAWVLRCPPWLWHIPFPLNQRHWSQRLPAPARNPKELLSRNFACFALPMLFGCSFPSLLPAWQILQQVNLLESSGWVATFRAFLVLGTDTLPYLLVIGATLLACLPLLVYCLYLLYRGGELKRFFLMYSAVALAFLAVSVLVRKYYSFNLRGYLIFIALVPITAHDRHLCAALQGLLLGLCVQEIAGRGGELPLWEETSGRL